MGHFRFSKNIDVQLQGKWKNATLQRKIDHVFQNAHVRFLGEGGGFWRNEQFSFLKNIDIYGWPLRNKGKFYDAEEEEY